MKLREGKDPRQDPTQEQGVDSLHAWVPRLAPVLPTASLFFFFHVTYFMLLGIPHRMMFSVLTPRYSYCVSFLVWQNPLKIWCPSGSCVLINFSFVWNIELLHSRNPCLREVILYSCQKIAHRCDCALRRQSLWVPISLEQWLTDFFGKKPDAKCYGLGGPYGLCGMNITLPALMKTEVMCKQRSTTAF